MNTKQSYTSRLQEAKSLFNRELYHEALTNYEVLRIEYPEDPKPIAGAGACLFAIKETTQALGCFVKAIELAPENAEYHLNTAICLHALDRIFMAITQYEAVLKIDDHNLKALTELAQLYIERNRNIEAAELLEKAVSIKASDARNQANLALALANIGYYEKAIKHGNKAIRLAPKNASPYYVMGQVHLIHGNHADAEKVLTKAIEIDPLFGFAYSALTSKKITKNDLPLIKKMENALNHGMSAITRQNFLYALGKAYNDIKETDKAMSYIYKAKQLNTSEFDTKSRYKSLQQIKTFFNKRFFNQLSYNSTSQFTHIFIIGMPRSGSTLVDQILSAHTAVYSGGESIALYDIVEEIKEEKDNSKFPICLNNINSEDIEKYRNSYIQKIAHGVGTRTHIIDKNLFNYEKLGLIAMLFPKAKIIHTKRHPLDNALSCYMIDFNSAFDWTDELSSIGKYYRSYLELMDHWHKTLPLPILDVQYEDMVADPEKNVRRLLEFCELKWEDQCLEFYNSKRSVNTASIWQVRQPVYKSSVQRWVPYAKHLQPLILALGDVIESDYEMIESLGLKHGPRHNNPLNKISKLFK